MSPRSALPPGGRGIIVAGMTAPGEAVESARLQEQVRHAILMARQRIYAISGPTPLSRFELPDGPTVYLKREDHGPIHAYKWRGACNRVALMSPEERARGVVTASAGNHAQGVALAAARLGTTARIFMPVPTPRTKQDAVRRHGGDAVEVILTGDTFDAAKAAALEDQMQTGQTYLSAFDDLAVIGGQGTLGDEIVMSGAGPFHAAFLQVGGGGMAGGTATWLRTYYPDIRLVGVEGTGQASMQAAIAAGHPVLLRDMDIFADGTAIGQAGELTLPLCRDLIDAWVNVTNEELSVAIALLWEHLRCIPEPAGAMGLAGLLREKEKWRGKKVICICCGANMDFRQLATISRQASTGARDRHYFRVYLSEEQGSFLRFLEDYLADVDIIELQYGKDDPDEARYVIGFVADPLRCDGLRTALQQAGIRGEEVTGGTDVQFRVIRYHPPMMHLPLFFALEFPQRAGALLAFLREAAPLASLCYFNYADTGERVGRALIGCEFHTADDRERFEAWLQRGHPTFLAARMLAPEELRRML